MGTVDSDNPWVRDVRAAHRRLRASLAVLAATVFSVTVLMSFRTWGGALQETLATVDGNLPGAWPDIVNAGVLQCLIFGLFFVAAAAATGFEGRRMFGRDIRGVPDVAGGLAVGALGFCAAVGIAGVAGAIATSPAVVPPPPIGGILIGLGVVAVQSLAEEAFFRGWLQPILCADWGTRAGLVVTSALFGALHVIAGAHGPLAVANLFLGGLLFGLLALGTGNLLAPAAAHFAWNWTESGVLGLTEDPGGSLFNLKLTGAPIWNGGADTMNGSAATTAVLLALVAAALVWSAPRWRPEPSPP